MHSPLPPSPWNAGPPESPMSYPPLSVSSLIKCQVALPNLWFLPLTLLHFFSKKLLLDAYYLLSIGTQESMSFACSWMQSS